MNIRLKIYFLVIFVGTLYGIEADAILYKALDRFKGLDRHFTIEITEKKKNGKST